MDKECPTCGRDDFASRRTMKIHHAKEHGERITATIVCKNCESEFEVHESHTDRRTFCSTECKGEFYSESRKGEKSPFYERVELVCEKCGSGFEVLPKREDKARFCSDECRCRWLRELEPEEHPRYKERKTFVCDVCGEKYQVKPANEERTAYCSRECQTEAKKELYGPKAPQWKGGGTATIYSAVRNGLSKESWERLRRRERGRECENCGAREGLHLHHIIPVMSGGTNGEWNLMTLCEECHSKADSLISDIQERVILPEEEKTMAKEQIPYYLAA